MSESPKPAVAGRLIGKKSWGDGKVIRNLRGGRLGEGVPLPPPQPLTIVI